MTDQPLPYTLTLVPCYLEAQHTLQQVMHASDHHFLKLPPGRVAFTI